MKAKIEEIVRESVDRVFELGEKTFLEDGELLRERIEEMAKAKGYPSELTDMLVWSARDSYYAGHQLLEAYLNTLVRDLAPRLAEEIQNQVLKSLPKSQ